MEIDLHCPKCKKLFSTKYSLERHKQTSKTCGAPKSKSSSKESKESKKLEYHCQFCTFKSKLKANVKRHEETCKKAESTLKEKEIAELQNQVKELKTQVKQIGKLNEQVVFLKGKVEGLCEAAKRKSRTKNTTVSETVVPFTRERIDEYVIEHYNVDLFQKGISGLVQLIKTMVILENGKKIYQCSGADTRKKFEMVIETDAGNGMEWKTDPGGSFIFDNLFDSIKEANLIDGYYDCIIKAKYYNSAAKAAATDQVSPIYCAILEKSEDHVKRKAIHREIMKRLAVILKE
jgi:uncharacterized C2H2 Zn-finger protein